MLGRTSSLFRTLRAFGRDESGASIIVIALTLPAFIGAVGLAAEVSYWRLHNRAMQHAADSAAIAAATNNSSNYAAEGKAVAAEYGFTDGTNQITVSVTNPATASGCTSNCYVATVSDKVPLLFSQVVGFNGNATVGGQHRQTITATSVATTTTAYTYCLIALASSGAQGITCNGCPNANLNGCNVMSNTGATCHGHNMNATEGDAHDTNNGCGNIQNSNVPVVTDPYSGLASNIPANTCSSYPQESKKGSLPASNQLSGTYSYGSYEVLCGDQQLVGNTTINNTVLVIENGQLDTNGYTLQGSNLTIVFSGTNSGNDCPSAGCAPTGGGTLDIAAPTSGTWSGVAIYQAPSLTKNVNISAAGNSPTWNISGLVYLPHSSVTLSGAVSKSSSGATCFELVVDNITINGTGDIFANDDQCTSAGLNQVRGGSRGMLVN